MLRTILCCLLVVAALAGGTATTRAKAGTITLTSPEKNMLTLINHARTSRGLHKLRMVGSLERAARAHSRDMLSRDYFSHYSYGGATFATRLVNYGYKRAGCSVWKAGEVIGWGKGTAGTARSVFRQWMKSAAHKAVILTHCWRDVGVGARLGTFESLTGVRMFTVDFGRRVQ